MSVRRRKTAVVDGQFINIASQREAIERMIGRLRQRQGFTLFTLNLDHLVKRRAAPEFVQAYAKADFVSADGLPVAVMARRQMPELERVTGSDLIVPLARAAARHAIPVALFGSSEAVLAASADRLRALAPGLEIRHIHAPAFGFDPSGEEALESGAQIVASGARICLIALGAPKQELLAARWRTAFPGLGMVCIGAGLDFLSGARMRAPFLLRLFGFEWLFRLALEPRRLAKRYGLCVALLADLAWSQFVGRPARPIRPAE